MAGDHLDQETSLSAELTESGIKASAKSRLVAAIDRLGGNLFELANAPLEARIGRQRAKAAGEQQLIQAAVQYGIERMKRDPEFAQRAIEANLNDVFRTQENRDGVLKHALEQLTLDPPTEQEASAGGESLDQVFSDKFDGYARTASTEELRERWGRVLASEIKRPGTFNRKALRVIDEMTPAIAREFESFCEHRIGGVVPKFLVQNLDFNVLSGLVTSDLLIEPGLGQTIGCFEATGPAGQKIRLFTFGSYGFSLPEGAFPWPDQGQDDVPLVSIDRQPFMPVYALTETGEAIASILPDMQSAAFDRLYLGVCKQFPNYVIEKFERNTSKAGSWLKTPDVRQNSSGRLYKFDDAAAQDLLLRLHEKKPVHLVVVGGDLEQSMGDQVESFLLENGYKVDRRATAVMVPRPEERLFVKDSGDEFSVIFAP
ncbi:DUF2806 domain-containing protein [Sinorhizobium fredii]|uniref:DUF2806 domain-containing protein n=1 Tax=Rhizobium fredii TaxID=380 RepID=UPI003518DE61